MKFLTDYELQHLEHASLRVKYRELQIVIEGLTNKPCECALDGVTCSNCQSAEMDGEEFDQQALAKTIEVQAKSVARDTAKGINGYGNTDALRVED